IFEYLEDKDLRSCLLVNRLWCEVSVRILWRVMQNFNTVITCLPNKSKAILYNNGIKFSTSTSRRPLFNYIVFIKMLWINSIDRAITRFLKNNQPSTLQNLDNHKRMITRETFKMLMNQTTLKILHFDFGSTSIPNIPFSAYPGGKECLKCLSEFLCSSNIYPEFFYQISRICHNLKSLKIIFTRFISNGLAELISVQQNLKYLNLDYCNNYLDEGQLLSRIPNTLTKIHIVQPHQMQLSFLSTLSNLQELSLSFFRKKGLKDFKNLQYVTMPQLQILMFEDKCPSDERLINFLKNNGKNLKVLGFGKKKCFNDSLSLAIAKFCPILRSLRVKYRDSDSLKVILKGCEQLESIDILYDDENYDFILESELEMVVELSPKKLHEIKIDMGCYVDLETTFQWELKSIFNCWSKRVPCIPLSLTITSNLESEIKLQESNVRLIEKFKKLGVIKEFKIINDMNDVVNI
ncbi:10148_t:CDS:1, partial [Funneliformis geosporum]